MRSCGAMATGDTVTARIDCRELETGRTRVFRGTAGRVTLLHREGDPESVNRIHASVPGLTVEVLPSKGFSIGQAWQDETPVFWEPPIGLCDPERLDLHSAEVAIEGEPAPGFTFLKTFSGGIELYGLRNWGMPFRDPGTGVLHPLHGETSSIPVDICEVSIGPDEVILTGVFVYRDMPLSSSPGESAGPWYMQGEELFRVERQVVLERQGPRLRLNDRITNVSLQERLPDWGYHITFHPGSASSILVPSRSVENRSGGPVPADFERWLPAPDPAVREERGMIHKGLQVTDGTGGISRAMIIRKDDPAVRVSFPAAPYFQTWICRGGANSREFTWASDGKPLFQKPWDGIGIELGSSALDHDGNTDPDVAQEEPLSPGASRVIRLRVDFPAGEALDREILDIGHYTSSRNLKKRKHHEEK